VYRASSAGSPIAEAFGTNPVRTGDFLNIRRAPTCAVLAGYFISNHERSSGGIGLVIGAVFRFDS
jgi:hypothetical protein